MHQGQINYASLIPPPDMAQAKILVIPQGIGSGRLLSLIHI